LFKMFDPTDRILIPISGGKDSAVLAYFLSRIERRFPSQVFGVVFDEGIPGLSNYKVDVAKKVASICNISIKCVSYAELFGETLPTIASRVSEKLNLSACSICSILRRRAIDIIAKELSIDKIAIAHNLNDVVETALLAFLRGDEFNLVRLFSDICEEIRPRRVRPLMLIPEQETALAHHILNLPRLLVECPFSSRSMRRRVKRFLYIIDTEHPGSLYSIFWSIYRTAKQISIRPSYKTTCKNCGFPSRKPLCQVCEILTLV